MPLDREALVRRHTVTMTGVDPTSPLSVGNGETCWTVDVTGLQTYRDLYPVTNPGGGAPGTLLGTQNMVITGRTIRTTSTPGTRSRCSATGSGCHSQRRSRR